MLLLLYFYLTLWYVHLILNFSTQGLYCPCDFPPQTLQFPNSHSSHSCCNEIYAFTLPSPTLPSCLVLSCLVLSCLVLSCLVLSWRDVTWRVVSCRFISCRHSFLLSFFLSLPLISTRCRFRGLLLHLIAFNKIHTVGRTHLDKRSVCRRDFYLTAHNIHKRQTAMPPAEFEPAAATDPRLRPCGNWDQLHYISF